MLSIRLIKIFQVTELTRHSNSQRFSSSPSFVSRRRRHSPSPSRELTVAAHNRRLARSPSLLPIVASLLGSSSVEEGACGYDDEQQWPNETEMVAEVRQRVSNMAGVTKEEVRIVASSYRICPLGAHIDHQEILKSKFGSGVSHHKKAREMPSSMLTGHWLRILKTRRNTFVPGSQGTAIIAPKPIRATPDLVTGLEDLSQP
ncbi:Galacturonokinase [Arachis hypogaea]|nr:Galacturonokinase [Arachis hypogaea]